MPELANKLPIGKPKQRQRNLDYNSTTRYPAVTAADIGKAVRFARKRLKLTQAGMAAACGTGVRFIVDLEKGKPTSAVEKVLTVVKMLGIKLELSFPTRVTGDGSK